ncbi:helix-turn-helix transcriptional regulator (plasmid) [Lactobacillus sp. PV037]|uniref:helix-turn-helix domain-containing protein n=1 Tax=unclassified Lactobacillus TaxID=2620435 RepID=UPI00223F8215|nr:MULTISPECIES: helix-turn-helix transcriptional regulator [unclassified Lactobacillus]QNQ82911.1 helix-turn-helix transcriptional regulator [Lactobacillus sp. PV012]QNQ83016.1 helix-turn-helix transcriptional regulator [Lactobacillus sp. PV037]
MMNQWIGNRIKELRAQTGLSQEKFAMKINMDRSYFADVELGNRNISINNLEKIIKGFDITFEDFFKGV